ncbi:MAG: sugar phosphate isomerase/epimerase [Bacteroidales bacterium]|jgi:sugar phosphate isomerase/epimerase
MKFNRRDFIKITGTGALAAGMPALASGAGGMTPPAGKTDSFKLAIAGYTFAQLTLDQALAIMQRTGVSLLGIKDMHLSLDSTQETINAFLAKADSFGVKPYGVGVIYMKTEAEADRAFAYARMVGVPLIVGAPDVSLLPYVEKKVKEYDLRLGIHNHGPDQKLYPGPDDVWEAIKNLDKRIGYCLDIGHTTRLGLDPVAAVLKYHERIFDFHVWDTDKPVKAGGCVEAGRGIIDFPKFFKTLREVKYEGTVSLEYTKDMRDPLPGIAESIGYFRGVLAGLV